MKIKALFCTFFKCGKIATLLTHPQWGQASVQHSGLIRHKKPYSEIIQEYSGSFRDLYNPSIFRTLAYSELWYVHHPGTFRALVYTEL